MQIIQEIKVKQIITEKSKQNLINKYKSECFQLKKECEQLLFERKRLEKQKKFDPNDIRARFDIEVEKRQHEQTLLTLQIEQLEVLPIGSEIYDGTVQALCDVKIGDDWGKLQRKREIIVKDGIVSEIR